MRSSGVVGSSRMSTMSREGFFQKNCLRKLLPGGGACFSNPRGHVGEGPLTGRSEATLRRVGAFAFRFGMRIKNFVLSGRWLGSREKNEKSPPLQIDNVLLAPGDFPA